ncbi:MAG: deoxyribose-phosphate aldolase [Firmicutes bacterium]|nr:deoxyribose-phosphate aldolase [Bacillota bacterium]
MNKPLNKYIDHTMLKPDAGEKAIINLCREALEYDFYSVCVNSCYVSLARTHLRGSDIKVSAVAGFPLGAMSSAAKLAETRDSLDNGASEIDVVINIGALKDQHYDYILSELSALAELCHSRNALLKVITETCLLTENEITEACRLVMKSGADFIKTSTGFSSGGAEVRDVRLMKKIIGNKIMIKASGGIRTLETAEAMIEAGADRLGCSASVEIMDKYIENKIRTECR